MKKISIVCMLIALMFMSACGADGPQSDRVDVSDGLERLDVALFSSVLEDSSRPLNILLVGDGTGTSLGGWSYLAIQALSNQYGRPGLIHDWNFEVGEGYLAPPIEVSTGSGQPLVLWNASVSRNISYLSGSLDGIRPAVDVDLVLVNNGVDMGPSTLANESIALMLKLSEQYPRATVAAILQPAPPESGSVLRSNVLDLATSSKIRDFQTIDVAAAFEGRPDLYDGNSPYANSNGQRVWAEEVVEALSSQLTASMP